MHSMDGVGLRISAQLQSTRTQASPRYSPLLTGPGLQTKSSFLRRFSSMCPLLHASSPFRFLQSPLQEAKNQSTNHHSTTLVVAHHRLLYCPLSAFLTGRPLFS